MKSKKIKIQTILMKGTIVFLILTMLSSFLPIISVFAEEIDETATGSSESTNGNIIDEESDYILSEDAEHITGIVIDEIDKLKEQLQNIDESFNYTNFVKKIALQPVIEISNELELRALSIFVAEGCKEVDFGEGLVEIDWSKKTFKLTKNIVLTDTIEWNPIGDINNPFSGTFDGAGYTISGMLISIKQSYAGFVGYLHGGTIKNLTIANSKIFILPEVDNKIQNDLLDYKTVTNSYLGAIAGRTTSATISNCKSTTDLSGGNIVGGIVGRAENTTVEYCSNSGKVQAYRTAGGIVGSYNTTVEGTNINNCINNGEVYAIAEGAGGISGTAWNKSVIKNCINNGSVYTAKDKLTIYVYGQEETVTPQNAGGITSAIAFDKDNAGTVVIENCINNGKVDGFQDIGGLIGQAGAGSNTTGKIEIKKCINYYRGFNVEVGEGDTAKKITNEEYYGRKSIGEFIGYAAVLKVPVTITDSYITTEVESSSSTDINGYKTKYNSNGVTTKEATDRIRAIGKQGSGTITAKFSTDTKNLFNTTDDDAIKSIKDTAAPQIVEVTKEGTEEKVKRATITNIGKSQSFAVKGDVLIITIPFNEPIRINRGYPTLYLNKVGGINDEDVEYVGIDGNNLLFKYKVTGKESTSSIDLTKVVLSGPIYDVFENVQKENSVTGFKSVEIELDKVVKIVNTNTQNVQQASISYPKDDILYTISGFSKVTEDGKLYFNKNSDITIKAEFGGKLSHSGALDEELAKDTPVLHIFKKEEEWCSIEKQEGKENVNITDNIITYEFNVSEYASKIQSNKPFEINSLYLTTDGDVIVGEENFGQFTKTNTGVEVSNIYVDIKSPKLTMTTVVNNKTDNNRYTVGEDILIKVTSDEAIDIENSVRPEINVSFSKSGLGKYNSQEDSTKTGNAKYTETIANEDGTVTYKYRYTVQDGDEGRLSLDCISNEVYDIAGNTAIKTEVIYNTDNMYVDTTAPTVTITTNKANPTNENEIEYIFISSEKVTDFGIEDITVNNGKIINKNWVTGPQTREDGSVEYTLRVKPEITGGNEGILQVIVEADACKDLVGFGNIRQESNITIDKVRPTFTSYEIKENNKKIIIESIFSEALSDATKLIPTIIVDGENGRGTWEETEVYGNKVRFVYNIAGADGGKVEASLEGIVTDIAGNNSEKLNIQVENDIILEQNVINDNKDVNVYYEFKHNGDPINDFTAPRYFVNEDTIEVIKYTETESGKETTTYSYKIQGQYDNLHMKYMTLTEPLEGEDNGKAAFSNGYGLIDILKANIYFDTVAPTIELSAKVEEKLESGVYAEGTKIVVEAKTSETIVNKENMPQINVSFSNSGLGKYNYQGENSSTGNAKYIEIIENKDGSISWKYEYIVQNGDEGSLSLEYANEGEIEDLAGNKTTLEEYPEVSIGNVNLNDIAISGKETKISYEIYKNNINNKITDFKNNTYFADGDTIIVIAKFNNELYSDWGSNNVLVSDKTAPKLEIDEKVFEVNRIIENKEIEYIYTVNGDVNEKLKELKLTTIKTLHAKKSDNTYEPISGKLSEVNIQNCNLHIYNAGTKFDDSNINVDTTAPTVQIIPVSSNPTKSNTVEYRFIWSEEVVDFTVDDITINNGKIKDSEELKGPIKNVDGTISYTLLVDTKVEEGNVGDIQVIVEKNACQDKVGLSNVRTESVIRVDKRAPIIIGLEAYAESTINLDSEVDNVKQYYKAGDVVTIITTFDEHIFDNTSNIPTLTLQFSKSGNAKGNVSKGIIEGNKITYTYTIKEEDEGTLSVKGFSGIVRDNAGNETIVTKRELTGDTIIADSTAPELVGITAIAPNFKYENLLSNEGETKRYGIGETITFVTEYNENVYNLTSNTIKVIDEETAPSLKIKFGTTERPAIFDADKTEGNKIYYTYTITSEDNGNLNISSLTGTVSDIVGNTLDISKVDLSKVNKAKYEEIISEENKIEVITADTTKPEISYSVSAINYDDNKKEITGNGYYYRKGSEIIITATTNEYIYQEVNGDLKEYTNMAPTLHIKFSETEDVVARCTGVDYIDGKTIFTYTYTVKENDSGTLNLKIISEVVSDIALNKNTETSEEINYIVADTRAPYIAENTNGISQWEIASTSTSITAIGIFSEELYVMDETNNLTKLSNPADAPIMGIFADGEMKGTAQATISTVNGKTKITYTYNTSQIDAENISVNIIDKTLYDIAGNEWSLDINADTSSPKFYNIQVLTTYGNYNRGDQLEIIAKFYEATRLTQAPKLTISIGEEVIELTGTINDTDELNTERIKTVRYSYTVDDENGPLNIVSLIGTAHDGTRGNEINKVYKSEDENVIVADNREILNFGGMTYSNNENAGVIVDTIPPTVTITSDVEETNQDVVTYTFTWSEPVYGFTQKNIEVINALKGTFTSESGDTIYTLTVDTTNEGRQIVKVNSGACEDRAGNENTERKTYNKVEIDYTKPTVRAKVNGGNFVIDTDSQKSTLKETIVVNEELSKFEYAWSTQLDIEDIPTKDWKTEDVSDIIVNSDINLSKEIMLNGDKTEEITYLYLKVTDKAGNLSRFRTKEFKVRKSEIKFEGISDTPTKEDVTVTVKYGEGVTENRKAGISGKTLSADPTKVILSENGTVYAEATDKSGNKVYATQEINNIDKTAPTATIKYTENEDGSVKAEICLTDGWVTNNNGERYYTFKENGEFTFEYRDEAGNTGEIVAKVTTIKVEDTPVVEEDKTAPEITFNYTTTTATVGTTIGATIIVNEDAIISYSWDNKNWISTDGYVRNAKAIKTPNNAGEYTLYAKATDKASNTSEVKTLKFTIVADKDDIVNPEIIFEDLYVVQVDGIKYVKVSPTFTVENLTAKMNKEALAGETPEYKKLASDNKLKTGTEITIKGVTKYIVIVNGDVNCDGEVTFLGDVIMANNYRIGQVRLSKIQQLAADINNNRVIDFIPDIIAINNYRLGIVKSL